MRFFGWEALCHLVAAAVSEYEAKKAAMETEGRQM